jgi:hypothetical protein
MIWGNQLRPPITAVMTNAVGGPGSVQRATDAVLTDSGWESLQAAAQRRLGVGCSSDLDGGQEAELAGILPLTTIIRSTCRGRISQTCSDPPSTTLRPVMKLLWSDAGTARRASSRVARTRAMAPSA